MSEKAKNNMGILSEIRAYRNKELGDLRDYGTRVEKVEDLGKGKNTGINIYRLIEVKDNGTYEIERFYQYDNGPVLIAIRNKQVQDDRIKGQVVPTNNEGYDLEKMKLLKEDIEQRSIERENQVKAIAKLLGIDEKDIDSLSEIELAQKIDEKQAEETNGEKEAESSNEPKKISKEEMKNVGMTGLNEVNLQTQVDTKGTTLGSVLKLDGYTKIMVVHSYKLAELTDADGNKGTTNRTRFGLIAQKADGSFETIPETKLKQYRGSNNEITQIDNKEKVEIKKEDCIFEVPGTNKRLVVDQKDPNGITDVYLSQNTRANDGNLAQKLQDKYDGTERQDVEVRALFNANRGIDQAERSVKEAGECKEAGCKNTGIEEVDGDKNTGHIHIDPNSTEYQNAVKEIMRQGKVSEEEATRKLIEVIEEEKKNNRDINLEEAIEEAVQSIINDGPYQDRYERKV